MSFKLGNLTAYGSKTNQTSYQNSPTGFLYTKVPGTTRRDIHRLLYNVNHFRLVRNSILCIMYFWKYKSTKHINRFYSK